MALLDSAYKQRMVGALVLVALAVIFLPMLFSRQDEQRQVVVEAPAAPQAPAVPQVQVEPVVVLSRRHCRREPVPAMMKWLRNRRRRSLRSRVYRWSSRLPLRLPPPPNPLRRRLRPSLSRHNAAPGKPDTPKPGRPNGLPVSWSIQLASLSSREVPRSCRKPCAARATTPIRSADGKNRVFVGPLIERAEADRLRDLLIASRTSRVLWCVSSLSAADSAERVQLTDTSIRLKCTANHSLPTARRSAKMRRLIRL
jgi:DedD protein